MLDDLKSMIMIKILSNNLLKYKLYLFLCFFLMCTFVFAGTNNDSVVQFDNIVKKSKSKSSSLIYVYIDKYNLLQVYNKHVNFLRTPEVHISNCTIEYFFSEISKDSIDEVKCQISNALDLYGNMYTRFTSINVNKFKINFYLDNNKFLYISSDQCKLFPNGKIILSNNIQSNNILCKNKKNFILDNFFCRYFLRMSYMGSKNKI